MRIARWFVLGPVAVFGVFWLLAALATVRMPSQEVDVSHQRPFADIVGREYRVISDVYVLAWNDYPDRERILDVTLMTPPLVANRFVTSRTRLATGQPVRIVGARLRRRGFFLLGTADYHYIVSVPGLRLPEGIPVQMDVDRGGIPNPAVYAPVER